MDVELSTDGGINYTTVLTSVMRNNGTTGWKLYTVDLSPYNSQTNVRLGFLAISDYNGNMYLDDVTVGDPAPNYVAQKSAAPSGACSTGDVVTYTVVFTNTGDLTGTAALNDPIPAGAQYVSGSVTGGAVYSETLNAVVWGPDSLAPNNSVTTTFRVTLTATNGFVTNTATLSDTAILAPVSVAAGNAINTADFNSSSNAANAGGNIHPTGVLTYTVVVYNSVTAITATATLTDPIPAGASYRPGSASVQGGGTLLADTTGITWTGTVTGGQKVTVTFGVALTALTGNVTNTAYLNSPYIDAPVVKAFAAAVQPYSAGPDLFGYVYQDSYAPGGPAFTWAEPLTTSKLSSLAGGTLGDGYYLVNLPFPFAFYTNVYTQVYPSTNGLMAFGTGSTASANATVPTSAAPNDYAACYWDDLRIISTNPITEGVFSEVQGTAPNRRAVLTFSLEDMYYASGTYAPMQFQMLLYEGSNQILCQYKGGKSLAPHYDGQSATIGLENAAGLDGLLYAYNRNGVNSLGPVEEGLAILLSPPQRPNYAAAKTVLPTGLVYPGDLITYSIVITNYGAVNGTAVISDPLPAGVTYGGSVPGDPYPPSFDGTTVAWTVPITAAHNTAVRFLANVLPSLTGFITNTATLSDTLIPAPLTAQVSSPVAIPRYITSSKSVTPAGIVSTGQMLTYTVSISNSGPLSGTATMIDPIPAGTTYVPGSAIVVSGGGALIEDGATITWTGTVTNGALIQVRFNATVTGIYGVITNTASITDTAVAAPVLVSAPGNPIASPILSSSSKTANLGAVPVGGGVTYVVTIKNTGVLTANSASLSDALPPQVTLDPAQLLASSGSVTGTASSVSWQGVVAPAATVYVTVPVTVLGTCCGQAVLNTAVISAAILPAPVMAVAAPVQIYGPYASLSEGFESAFPPGGWTTLVVTPASATPAWTQVITGDYPVIASGPYAGAYMAKFNSFNVQSGGAARLGFTTTIPLAAQTPRLVFWMYHDPGYATPPYDRIQIQVSTDGGSSFANVGLPFNRYAASAGWQVHMLDLSAYGGQNVGVSFLAISAYGNNMFLDEVSVRTCCELPAGVSFNYTPASPLTNQEVNFTGVVLTSTAPMTYTWNFGDGSPLGVGNPISHTYTLTGPLTVVMTAVNSCGAVTYTAPITIAAAPTPPVVTLASSAPTILGNPTTFTATLLSGSAPLTYTWNFGDGSPAVENGLTITHTYAAGSYTAVLTATNSVSQTIVTTPVAVGVGPGAMFTSNSPVNAPVTTTVRFTFTGANTTAWLWNFGDTFTSTLPSPTHTYAAPPAQTAQGYTVTLTASNAYGSVRASAPVTVTNYFVVWTGLKLGPPLVSASRSVLSYTLRVTNTGGLAASGATLVDTFPVGATGPAGNVTASTGALSANTPTGLVWSGTLNAGEGLTLTFSLTPTASCGGEVLTNTAGLSAPQVTTALTLTAPGTQLVDCVVLAEEFNDPPFPPAGWGTATVTDTGTYGVPAWTRVTAGAYPVVSPHGGAALIKFNAYDADAGDAARLFTPALNFATVAHPSVQFWMYHDPQYAGQNDRVQVQVEAGAGYQNVGEAVSRYDGSTGWKLHRVDLLTYAGQSNVRVAFLGIGAYGHNLYLDDMAVIQSCNRWAIYLPLIRR